jgi:serine/threonine-protein kinase
VPGLSLLTLNATTGTRTASSSYQSPKPDPTPAATGTTSSPKPTPSPAPIPDADHAGRTDDDSAAIAVTLRDGRAIAYFCDGRAKEARLKGEVGDDGTLRLTGKNGARPDGTLREGKRIRRTGDVGGGRYAFTADKAKKSSGPYRATATVRGATIDGGWIVLRDGAGILTRDGEPSPAPRIDPETGAVTVDGQQLTTRPATP